MRDFRIYLALALSCAAWGPAHAEISGNVCGSACSTIFPASFRTPTAWFCGSSKDGGGGFQRRARNIKVEIVYADHQNKADVGSAIARKWLDVDGVDAMFDVRIRPSVSPSIRWFAIPG